MRSWKYRSLPTAWLRVLRDAFTGMSPRWAFARDLAQIEWELTVRELDAIAHKSGGYLVAWIVGEQ